MVKTFNLKDFNYEVELGTFAQQADGAVWFKYGGTVVLATAVSAPSKDFPGFFPLTVEYREQFAAAGKIPGGYYKREGRPSENEMLNARLIDRALRPLFPADYFDQVQVIVTVYSVDKEHAPHTIALIAASMALSISKIPFMGPVGAVEAARIDGAWKMNPTYPETLKADGRIMIAGTVEGIVMVEGLGNEIDEKEFVDVLFQGHESIKKVVTWQESIKNEEGVPKEQYQALYDFDTWRNRAEQYLTLDRIKTINLPDKVDRDVALKAVREGFLEENKELLEETDTPQSVANYLFDSVLVAKATEFIFVENKRIDNRTFEEIRPISIKVGLLPFTHGSAMFKRGRTQALVTVTLGSGDDEQRSETLMSSSDGEVDGSFMLHYNFPPFSVGEARFLRGPGRREIGHGHLAASSFKYVRPHKEQFPYTIRIVADILESNGSSSMATVCGATMAMMQGGVPITKMVSGIAMGLLKSNDGSFKVLSDITGFEDAFGLMDFKIAGTQDGITAIQMDIKYKGGLARDVFEKAMGQARTGRLFILEKMREVMSAPNPNLSDLVPQVTTLKINTDKIGAVIGSGGKTIREIIAETGTSIDIEPDGMVKIFGGPDAKTDVAIKWVKTLAGQLAKGDIFDGKIKRTADFGLFVELVPGVQGLVHISNIPRDKQRDFSRTYKQDEVVKVEVLDYDDVTGRISLRIITN
jgi:polyribonucleotide nucleotidyltransferase